MAEARTLFRWMIAKKLIGKNPTEWIEVLGRRRRGKPQLSIDECAKLYSKGLELAAQGDVGATTVLCCPLMGCRATEVTDRIVREIDANGTIFAITASKTRTGIRRLPIPKVLQPLLAGLCRGKASSERVFGEDVPRHWLRYHVQRLCQLSQVPMISPHGLRGSWASISVAQGVAGDVVAKALGHTSFENMTARHYAQPDSIAGAATSRVAAILGAN